jgi:hypothetical protein
MDLADIENWVGALSTADKLALFGAAATLVATLATLIAVLVAVQQLRAGNKTARGQFWLMLRSVMTQYDDIHANYRPRGRWHASLSQPDTVTDWARTELYMGLLEYCNKLMDDGLLDKTHFKDWYKYRIENLLSNPRVVTYKLREIPEGWRQFYALCEKMRIPIPPATNGLPVFIRQDHPGSLPATPV